MNPPSSTAGRPRRNAGWVYEDRVDGAAAGLTVLGFYAQRYRHSTESQWRARIGDGQIQRRRDGDAADGVVDGVPRGATVLTDTVLAAGDILRYHRPPWLEPAAPRAFAVLHQDDDVLAVAKPSGLQVLPAASFLENTLLHVVREKRGAHWAPAHRLGRGTSGIVLFAAGDAARRQLAADFRDGGLRKVYRALVQGAPRQACFDLKAPIGRLAYPGLGHVWAAVDDGKPSCSRVRVLEMRPEANATLVEVEIPTGRPHQIRIHLAWAGHPLVGEPLYAAGGRPREVAQDGAARPPLPGDLGYQLHAARVTLAHPVTGAQVTVACRPPEGLRRRQGA